LEHHYQHEKTAPQTVEKNDGLLNVELFCLPHQSAAMARGPLGARNPGTRVKTGLREFSQRCVKLEKYGLPATVVCT